MRLNAQSWRKLHFILSILAQKRIYLHNLGQKIQGLLNLGTKLKFDSHSWLETGFTLSFLAQKTAGPLIFGQKTHSISHSWRKFKCITLN